VSRRRRRGRRGRGRKVRRGRLSRRKFGRRGGRRARRGRSRKLPRQSLTELRLLSQSIFTGPGEGKALIFTGADWNPDTANNAPALLTYNQLQSLWASQCARAMGFGAPNAVPPSGAYVVPQRLRIVSATSRHELVNACSVPVHITAYFWVCRKDVSVGMPTINVLTTSCWLV